MDLVRTGRVGIIGFYTCPAILEIRRRALFGVGSVGGISTFCLGPQTNCSASGKRESLTRMHRRV